MKRSDITDIWPEATKEQIDKLMGINGTDINNAKSELDGLKAQLTTAQSELQKLKDGAAGQPDKLKETQDALAALQTELNGMKHAEAVRQVREKVSGEKKVPANLLTGETRSLPSPRPEAIQTSTTAERPATAEPSRPATSSRSGQKTIFEFLKGGH